ELFAILIERLRANDGLDDAEFDQILADAEAGPVGQRVRMSDPAKDAVERFQVLDHEPRAPGREPEMPGRHGPQLGEVLAALTAADLDAVGVERLEPVPTPILAEDLK